MICLNGEEMKGYNNLNELLEDNGYRKDRIAVEVNGKIIKKSDYNTTVINDGDEIEVVSFVGGG